MSDMPLVCAECGGGFWPPTHAAIARSGDKVYAINKVDGHPLWCPPCLAKHAKPNPYLNKTRSTTKEGGAAGIRGSHGRNSWLTTSSSSAP